MATKSKEGDRKKVKKTTKKVAAKKKTARKVVKKVTKKCKTHVHDLGNVQRTLHILVQRVTDSPIKRMVTIAEIDGNKITKEQRDSILKSNPRLNDVKKHGCMVAVQMPNGDVNIGISVRRKGDQINRPEGYWNALCRAINDPITKDNAPKWALPYLILFARRAKKYFKNSVQF